MKYKITAPNTEYTGVSAGVSIVNGIGETEDENAIAWFKEKGYGIELTPGQPFVVESDECIKATLNEIKAMKGEEVEKIAAELKIDLSECKKVEEKKKAVMDYVSNQMSKEEQMTETETDPVGADET